jgi:hypothetical protein
MGWEATGLIEEQPPYGPRITGVRANTPTGPVEIPATLTSAVTGVDELDKLRLSATRSDGACRPKLDEGWGETEEFSPA